MGAVVRRCADDDAVDPTDALTEVDNAADVATVTDVATLTDLDGATADELGPAGASAPHPVTAIATVIARASSGVAIARAGIMPTNASPSVQRTRS